MKRLVAFSYHKGGNIANLSRIDPSLLGVKEPSASTRNSALYLHGLSSSPLLCFSLVLVTRDSHNHIRIFGTDQKEYVVKDVAGVLLTMELERFISVLGLAFDLPYIEDDSARRDHDLLHFSMHENAFSFATGIMAKSGKSSLDILYCSVTYILQQNMIMQKQVMVVLLKQAALPNLPLRV